MEMRNYVSDTQSLRYLWITQIETQRDANLIAQGEGLSQFGR